MNPQVPNELISAYFDGEVSPEERAEVERLLAESDEAQRELNEISKISAVLHSFPREFAPVTLASVVEERTNEMSLPKPARDPATRARDRLRDWKAALSGGLAMMLLVMVWNRIHFPQPIQDIVGERSLVAHSNQAQPSAAASPRFAKVIPSVTATGTLAQTDVAAAPMGSIEANPLQDAKQIEPNSDSKVPAIPPVTNVIVADSVAQVGPSKQDFIKNLHGGNLVQLADRDNNVGVIDLELSTIVDVEKGVGELRVILERHDIRPRSGDDKPEEFSGKLAERKASSKDDEVYMIYTVGTGGQFAETLQDVDLHRDIFKNWSNQQPLQLDASTPESMRNQIANANTKKRDEQPSTNDEGPLAASLFLARAAQASAASIDVLNRSKADDAKGENSRNKDASGSAGVDARAMKSDGNGFGLRNQQPARRAADGKLETAGNAFQQLMRVQRNSLELPANSASNALNSATNTPIILPTPLNQATNASPEAQAAFKAAKEEMRSENSNRLKMLWVLHPSSAQPATAPTSDQESASPQVKTGR